MSDLDTTDTEPLRCLVCGSAEQAGGKLSGFCACAKCGKAMGVRHEKCWVSEQTVDILSTHKADLKLLGFSFRRDLVVKDHLEILQVAQKIAEGAGYLYLARDVSVTTRQIIKKLKQFHIPYAEILCLRLEEPEIVKKIYDEEPTGMLD